MEFGGKGLAVAAMDREEARLRAMRERSEARRDRFLNARQRTIGVDVDALDAQIAEKEAQFETESFESDARVQRERYIAMLIEQREAEEREMKRRSMAEVRGTWDEQKVLPKNQMPKRGEPIDPAKCGPAAVQRLSGEDMSVYDRQRLQKEQMRSWTMQQMAEKTAVRGEEASEAARYAAYVKMLTERRAMLEAEEAMEAKTNRLYNAAENRSLADEKAASKAASRSAEADAKVDELKYQMQSGLLCEDVGSAYSSDGRVRRDMFKGYSKEQLAAFYADNQRIIDEKSAGSQSQDAAWAAHSRQLSAMIEASEAERAAEARAAAMQHRDALKAQAEEHAARQAASKAGRFGAVGAGYFDGFGTSVR